MLARARREGEGGRRTDAAFDRPARTSELPNFPGTARRAERPTPQAGVAARDVKPEIRSQEEDGEDENAQVGIPLCRQGIGDWAACREKEVGEQQELCQKIQGLLWRAEDVSQKCPPNGAKSQEREVIWRQSPESNEPGETVGGSALRERLILRLRHPQSVPPPLQWSPLWFQTDGCVSYRMRETRAAPNAAVSTKNGRAIRAIDMGVMLRTVGQIVGSPSTP
jgi:hypothetical protein